MNDQPEGGAPSATEDEETQNGAMPASVKPDSVFDELKEQYARSATDRKKTILVAPGRYKGRLAVRLQPTEQIWKDYRKRAERMESRGGGIQAMLDFAATTIVQCCTTVLYRPTEEAELIPMAECVPGYSGGEPIKFDARLAEALGIALTGSESATQICRLAFKTDAALDDAFVTADAWLKEQIPSDVDEGEVEEGEGVRPT